MILDTIEIFKVRSLTYLGNLLSTGLSLWEWGSGDLLSGSLWWLKT